jgi:hypothetical protein
MDSELRHWGACKVSDVKGPLRFSNWASLHEHKYADSRTGLCGPESRHYSRRTISVEATSIGNDSLLSLFFSYPSESQGSVMNSIHPQMCQRLRYAIMCYVWRDGWVVAGTQKSWKAAWSGKTLKEVTPWSAMFVLLRYVWIKSLRAKTSAPSVLEIHICTCMQPTSWLNFPKLKYYHCALKIGRKAWSERHFFSQPNDVGPSWHFIQPGFTQLSLRLRLLAS